VAASRGKWAEAASRLAEEASKLPALKTALEAARTEYDKVGTPCAGLLFCALVNSKYGAPNESSCAAPPFFVSQVTVESREEGLRTVLGKDALREWVREAKADVTKRAKAVAVCEDKVAQQLKNK
jgi:hypothetical protein